MLTIFFVSNGSPVKAEVSGFEYIDNKLWCTVNKETHLFNNVFEIRSWSGKDKWPADLKPEEYEDMTEVIKAHSCTIPRD
jgi:hypothetical protein